MITTNMPTLQIHKLSQEQYDAAKAAGKIDENAIYLTPDAPEPIPTFSVTDDGNGNVTITLG